MGNGTTGTQRSGVCSQWRTAHYPLHQRSAVHSQEGSEGGAWATPHHKSIHMLHKPYLHTIIRSATSINKIYTCLKKKKGHKHIFKNTKQQRKNTLIINNIITILIKQKQAGQGHHHNDNNFNRRGKNGILRERILTIQIMTSHHKTTDKGRREGDARDSLNLKKKKLYLLPLSIRMSCVNFNQL